MWSAEVQAASQPVPVNLEGNLQRGPVGFSNTQHLKPTTVEYRQEGRGERSGGGGRPSDIYLPPVIGNVRKGAEGGDLEDGSTDSEPSRKAKKNTKKTKRKKPKRSTKQKGKGRGDLHPDGDSSRSSSDSSSSSSEEDSEEEHRKKRKDRRRKRREEEKPKRKSQEGRAI